MMITKNKFWASFILCHYAICIICTYSCSDNQKRFQEENADCKTETLKIKKNIPLEDFSVFIEKFHKDYEESFNIQHKQYNGLHLLWPPCTHGLGLRSGQGRASTHCIRLQRALLGHARQQPAIQPESVLRRARRRGNATLRRCHIGHGLAASSH